MTDVTNHSGLQTYDVREAEHAFHDVETLHDVGIERGVIIPQLAADAVAVVQANSFARRCNLFIKRAFDVFASSVALVVLGPFLLAIAVLIRMETPGSALFMQERWGLGMRKIRVYKFRSMYADRCDVSGVAQTVPGDARITRIGHILRRTNIDELPQLINVLKGDLSLVGPRCHPVGMRAAGILYEELVPQYHRRHIVLPGITGLAQVNGFRGPTTDIAPAVKRVEYDLEYISNFNVFVDIKILFLTVLREIAGGTGS